MTPDALRSKWSSINEEKEVVSFYGQSMGPYGCFSNFYTHEEFLFEIPYCCDRENLQKQGLPACVPVKHTEKAIMLCKASLMGDYDTYRMLLQTEEPGQCKSLGRRVKPWNQGLWDSNVCCIAFQVVSQKVDNNGKVYNALMSTQNSIIAEMTDRDVNWGTGVRMGKKDQNRPSTWTGSNILGWALMEVRDRIRAHMMADSSDGN